MRQLAIELEDRNFAEGWDGLRGIYAAAEQADPKNVDMLCSWAIAAMNWFEPWKTPELETRMRIAADGDGAIARAEGLAPDDAEIHYLKGKLFYNHPARHQAEVEYRRRALDCFEQAYALDPEHDMAMLYQAHCHHDAEDWEAAYGCYGRVDGDHLLQQHPHCRWRILKRDEQLALCAGELGREAEALERINRLFEKIEALTEEEQTYDVVNLDEAVQLLRSVVQEAKTQERLSELLKILDLQGRYSD